MDTKPPPEKPRVTDLMRIGISAGWASAILNGDRLPSMKLAKKIEADLGYPATSWLTDERA